MNQNAGLAMDQFAKQRFAELLDRLETQLESITRKADADAIHDVRVAIRRLTQALRAFASLFPKQEVTRMREHLRAMMDIAAAIRNRDIALELFQAAGVARDAPPCIRLGRERDAASAKLIALSRQWRQRKLAREWRTLAA